MIKLLMCITLSEIGGSQRVVYDIISNLPESLYEITLVTAPGGELLDWIAALNSTRKNKVRVSTLGCLKRNISPCCDLKAFIALLRLMRKTRFDIAHFHNSKVGIIGRLAATVARVPKVYYTVHGWGLNKTTTGSLYRVMSALERLVSKCCTQVVFVSKSDMEKGIQNRWAQVNRSCLIYNGVSDAPALPPHEPEWTSGGLPVIAFVSRLAEPKDPMFALKVSARLLWEGVAHRLLIVGNGPLYNDCVRLIEELGIGSHVRMLGMRDDVPRILKSVDVFCLFSKWEGLPITILEAMSCGLPVVASNVGGVSEMIDDGRTGYLLDDFQVDKAARRLKALLVDRDKRLCMGNTARAVALEKFSLLGMVSQYRRLYEQPANRRGRVS